MIEITKMSKGILFVTLFISALLTNAQSVVISDTLEIHGMTCLVRKGTNFIVLNSNEEYQRYYTEFVHIPECSEMYYKSPPVDFSKRTLLIYYTSASGCAYPNINVNWIYNEQNKQYLFDIVIKQNSLCRPLFYVYKVFSVPKAPSHAIYYQEKYIVPTLVEERDENGQKIYKEKYPDE